MHARAHTQSIKIHIYKIKKKSCDDSERDQKNVVCAVGEKDAPYYKARHVLDQRSWLFP